MTADNAQRLELLKLEMNLIQGNLKHYEELMFKTRNWFVALWSGLIVLAFHEKNFVLLLGSFPLSVIYWYLEGIIRYKYWYKYVNRYRTLRDSLNHEDLNIGSIALYDLTNQYAKSRQKPREKFCKSFFKVDAVVTYFGLCTLSLMLFLVNHFLKTFCPPQ